MKINELMIGDWVNADNKLTRINALYTDGTIGITPLVEDYSVSWHYFSNLIQPIPITEENLKLNDFYVDGRYITKRQVDDSFVQIDFTKNAIVVSIANYEEDRDFIGTLEYIHELQHALRLCGLNELADNWREE